MPCDSLARTREEQRQRREALEQLEAEIASGNRTVMKNIFTDEVSISDWHETAAAQLGVCEGCAMQWLSGHSEDSWVQQSLKAVGVEGQKEFVAASHNGHSHGGTGHGHGHNH